jgi:phosphoserine/homoserine phosphotransferase
MDIVCLDMEGVLVPEIWIEFAEKTGIQALKATTRDIPDYDVLMQQRLGILAEHKLKLDDIQEVIATLSPLEGAVEFLDSLREQYQLVILSDTFYEFAKPLVEQMKWPTIFCHKLRVGDDGSVTDYKIRQKDPKRMSVRSLKSLNFKVYAAGDSYNDTTMLEEADAGLLFRAPANVIEEFPQYRVTNEYSELRRYIDEAAAR